jgi:hypothetical protein
MNQKIELNLQTSVGNPDAHELDRETRHLIKELHNLNFHVIIDLPSDIAPEKTKTVDPVIVGAIIVALSPTFITKLLEFLHAWCMRREGRSIKIKIQLDEKRLIEIDVSETMPIEELKKRIDAIREVIEIS